MYYPDEHTKRVFVDALRSTGREGMGNVLNELEKSDFYTAPATSFDHDAYPGGLLVHSIVTMSIMQEVFFRKYGYLTEEQATKALSSILIVSLLHGVGRINTYKTYQKNIKDEDGNWVSVSAYKREPDLPFAGPAEQKALYLLQQWGLKLTEKEAMAISSVTNRECSANEVYKKYPLAFCLHIADEAAVFLADDAEVNRRISQFAQHTA